MQNRPRKAGADGEGRIAVQLVEIAVKTIEQRLLRSGGQIDNEIGRILRRYDRRSLAAGIATEAAAVADIDCPVEPGEDPAGLVAQIHLADDQRRLARAFVDQAGDATATLHDALARQGADNLEALGGV